jgi:transposase
VSLVRVDHAVTSFLVSDRARRRRSVCKYGLHLPLNRQSDILAREGFELDVSTLANWVGLRVADLALGRPREEATHIGPAGCWRTTKRPRKAAKAWCNLGGQNFETNAA